MQQKRIQHWLTIIVLCGALATDVTNQSRAADDSGTSGKVKPRTNRLAKETSPYLLLHAHNPVEWYPWGQEAFDKAKKEGKLVFLSVGYSSCYWCHVMERKVFSNESIAKTLNQDFVCIKVDREERPDIDDIYMTALQVYYQAIKAPSSGGWPLSMFLTPEGKPVAGGTYFPPEDTDGNQGFPNILARLSDLWKNKQDQVIANSDVLANETRRVMKPKATAKPIEIDQALAEFVFDAVASSFDPDFGGIDFHPNQPAAPKFPTPVKLAMIQQELQRVPNDAVSELLDLTLMQLACGGIRDQIGGGFHRYSVDRQWDVPHFEKMLYDQAQLADLFAEAFRTTRRPIYKQVAEELFEFIGRELTSPDGGFFSALDAETNGIEGEFYVWDASEIDHILGTTARSFKETYKVKDLSDFEHGNVLRLNPKRLPKAASRDSVVVSASLAGSVRDEFTVSRQKLLEVRNQRKKPLRDEKILTCWNGLMIGAYARAASLLEHPEYARTAERAAGFVLAKLRDPNGRLLHSSTNGQAKLNAYLDDYAFVIDGFLALYGATNDAKWLKSARQLQDDQLRLFLDENNGGFFFTSHQHEELLARTKNCYDGVLPAANSVSARNLIRLAKLTGASDYRDEARAVIELFAPQIEEAPRGFASLALACTELLESEAVEPNASSETTGKVIPASGADNKSTNEEPLILLADQKEARPKKDEHVKGRAYLSKEKLPAGGNSQFVVLLDVDDGWHVNANPPKPDNLIPVNVTFKSKLGTTLSEPKYPEGHAFDFAGDEVMAYEGEVAIRGSLTVPEKAGGQTEEMEILIEYQACHKDGSCQPKKTIKLIGKLAVAKKSEPVKSINSRLFPPAEPLKK